MKKILAALLLLMVFASPAYAAQRRHQHTPHYNHHMDHHQHHHNNHHSHHA